MIRLFVGIELPAATKEALSRLQAGVPNARWVEPDSLHLTLRFIGEVDESLAADIDAALAQLRAPAFDLMLTTPGTFYAGRRANVLWVGVERSLALEHLRDKVESAVSRAGAGPDQRKFTPHVTLARLKDAPADRVQTFLVDHALFRHGPVPIARAVMFSSHPGKNGSIYRVEREYPLG